MSKKQVLYSLAAFLLSIVFASHAVVMIFQIVNLWLLGIFIVLFIAHSRNIFRFGKILKTAKLNYDYRNIH